MAALPRQTDPSAVRVLRWVSDTLLSPPRAHESGVGAALCRALGYGGAFSQPPAEGQGQGGLDKGPAQSSRDLQVKLLEEDRFSPTRTALGVDAAEIEKSFRAGALLEPNMAASRGSRGGNASNGSSEDLDKYKGASDDLDSQGPGTTSQSPTRPTSAATPFQVSFDGGLSGAKFFVTADEKYVLKSVRSREQRLLQRMLPSYLEFIVHHQTSTLLPHYLALIQVGGGSARREGQVFILLPNVFYHPTPLQGTLERYDLKCSSYRHVTEEEAASGKVVGKDLNFCPACAHIASSAPLSARRRSFVWDLQTNNTSCDPANAAKIRHRKLPPRVSAGSKGHGGGDGIDVTALEQDLRLLVQWGVIDYSLVVAVAEHDSKVEWSSMGIIDCLQEYNTAKWVETLVRTLVFREPRKGVSSLPVLEYADRFLSFVTAHS
uniref:PIPK domain-containing protein n=1 Tax=Rhizochromulina marina TaxID=1034831 RepID=A0A7S2SVK5_9STRA|mmetsp:Transcript_9471/g.26795  ORF Transcript_9471/g.26795 Transcript_9471/m.26795 type:complete len:434 (+) Transcript_9471:51-1352(+)